MKIKEASKDHILFSNNLYFDVLTGHLLQSPPPNAQDARSSPEPKIQLGYREAVPQLQISMTDACNMACSYCAFRQRIQNDGKPVNMPLQIAKRAIEFFAETVGDKTAYVRIDFGLAGEPMLRRRAHATLQGWIREALASTGIKVALAGPMVTNATLALSDRELLESLGPPQDISCDGPKEVHDFFRPYTDGRGTYQDIEKVICEVLRRHPDIGVSAVLTAQFPRFDEIFLHLHEVLGFKTVYMKPVNAAHGVDYALNFENLPKYMEGYHRLIDLILAQSAEKRLSYLLALNPEDFFMRYFYRIKNRSRQIYRCGAGKSGAYVDTNGKLYPCAHFIGKSGWDIGNIVTGFDESKRRQFVEAHVDTREPCKSCWARYVCGGGCYYQAVLANGDMTTPDLVKCELIRFLCVQAIRLIEQLERETPEVLTALPSPFFIPRSDVDTTPEANYRPTGRLVRATEATAREMMGRGRAVGCLVDSRASATLRMNQEQGFLQMSFTWNEWAHWSELQLWFLDLEREQFLFKDLPSTAPTLRGILLSISPEGVLRRLIQNHDGPVREVPFKEPEWEILEEIDMNLSENSLDLSISLRSVFNRQETPEEFGFNFFVKLRQGGQVALSRYEPFLVVNAQHKGPRCPDGPEFGGYTKPSASINPLPLDGMVPLSQWLGLQGNVC